ncbi:1910_t:CDS:2, partial [Cetraspora pellucida]
VTSLNSAQQHMDVTFLSTYQYNLKEGDSFYDWLSVDTFMRLYCLEQGFGYQVFRNDKDPNDSNITHCKSFHCSSSEKIRYKTLIDAHNHELEPEHIVHLNARYRQLSNEMIEDLRFLTECKVAPVMQFE